MNKKILIITIIVFIIDQLSKCLASLYLKSPIIIINNFFKLNYATNTGAAFSILSNHHILLVLSSVVLMYVLYKFSTSFKGILRNNIAFGLLYGGILGNLFNRLFNSYVIDFLDFKIFNYDFPIFNIADVCIVISVILLIYAIIKGEDNEVSSRRQWY